MARQGKIENCENCNCAYNFQIPFELIIPNDQQTVEQLKRSIINFGTDKLTDKIIQLIGKDPAGLRLIGEKLPNGSFRISEFDWELFHFNLPVH